MATDPTGKSFLSYRRSRESEADLIISAQHVHGIPTWLDRNDLDEVPTADELQRVLSDPLTANAVIFVTPNVVESNTIRRIEFPAILQRTKAKDDFFAIPICAGGLDYEATADALDAGVAVDDLKNWNLLKIDNDPITRTDADEIAKRVLGRRLAAIARSHSDLPLKIKIQTRGVVSFESGYALILNWTEHFEGREALPESWREVLIPALRSVSNAIRKAGGNREILASGLLAIPAAVALGVAFLAPSGQKLSWLQYTPGRPDQKWNLDADRESTGFTIETLNRDVNASDLAVLVSVAETVEPAFAQTLSTLPNFRAITRVEKRGSPRFNIESPGQALDIALLVTEAIRDARTRFRPVETIHLFLSVPVGLAVLIGQMLNTLGPVQTYEHIPSDGVGTYRPAALLTPSE